MAKQKEKIHTSGHKLKTCPSVATILYNFYKVLTIRMHPCYATVKCSLGQSCSPFTRSKTHTHNMHNVNNRVTVAEDLALVFN